MKIEIYREAPFVDREREIEFLLDWFNDVPQRLLFIYGPKSSGKTTVIEYVIEKNLLTERQWWIKGKYWVKYVNLREVLISSYEKFLDALLVSEEIYEKRVKEEVKFSLKVFAVKREWIEALKRREEDLFKLLIGIIAREREKGRIPILVLDEIQKLRDVYIKNGNGERELLKGFLNFCVRLTKETHLCHVVILSSNTVFIERLFKDTRLKETSEFKKIDHLQKEQVKNWLKGEGFKEEERELVWEYIGGAIFRILKVIKAKKRGQDLKAFLEQESWLAYAEIMDCLTDLEEVERVFFRQVAEEIVRRGFFTVEYIGKREKEWLKKWAENEILFYDPLELKVTGNSRIYEKGMEVWLRRGR